MFYLIQKTLLKKMMSKEEEEEVEGEETLADSALGLFNKSTEELDNVYTIQPFPFPLPIENS